MRMNHMALLGGLLLGLNGCAAVSLAGTVVEVGAGAVGADIDGLAATGKGAIALSQHDAAGPAQPLDVVLAAPPLANAASMPAEPVKPATDGEDLVLRPLAD